MAEVSRTARVIQNAKVALFFYCINLVLQFFSRKIFLDYLGAELLGLNTTAQNLLQFLNLAESGIGAAVAFALYKPLSQKNRQEIIDIVTSWPGVSGAHDLRTRQSGPTRFIQIHLEMEDSLPLVQAHMVADQVEQAILRRFPGSDVIIHQDPCSVVPREGKRSMLS